MKKYILILLLAAAFNRVEAQNSLNYAALGVGVSASLNKPRADLKNEYENKSYAVTLNYYYTPYIPVGLEFQFGKLSGGGNTVAEDKDTRRYSNMYKALILHMDAQLGEFVDYERNDLLNIAKNFYAGIGVGGIYNNVDRNEYSLLDPTYKFPGRNTSINLIVPLRVGYEFKFYNGYGQPNVRLDIGYQHNITFGEGLDGYDDPSTKFKNNAPDQYRQITVGLKVNFGVQSTYDKDIKGY